MLERMWLERGKRQGISTWVRDAKIKREIRLLSEKDMSNVA